MVDLYLIDAIERLTTSLADVGKGGSKSAKEARRQLAEYEELYYPVSQFVEASKVLAWPSWPPPKDEPLPEGGAIGYATTPEIRRARWALANSFPALGVVEVAKRVKAGQVLGVVNGRAALRDPKTDRTYLGGSAD